MFLNHTLQCISCVYTKMHNKIDMSKALHHTKSYTMGSPYPNTNTRHCVTNGYCYNKNKHFETYVALQYLTRSWFIWFFFSHVRHFGDEGQCSEIKNFAENVLLNNIFSTLHIQYLTTFWQISMSSSLHFTHLSKR